MATVRRTVDDYLGSGERARPEVLCIRGRLQPDLNFVPVRCFSTWYVRHWPDPHETTELQLLDGQGDMVAIGQVTVADPVHHEGKPSWKRIHGYVTLRDGATVVRLMVRGIEAWRADIPEAASVKVDLGRVTNAGRATVKVEHSRPGPGAFVAVVLKWGDRRFRTVGFYDPARSLTLNLSSLPGGRRCRLVVHYCNGLRSAGDQTKLFALNSVPAEVHVIEPEPGALRSPFAPVDLRASVVDPQRGPVPDDDVEWLLDGKVVATGRIVTLDPLEVGTHQVTVRYGSGEVAAEAGCSITIPRPRKDDPVPGCQWDDHDG